MYSSLAIQWYTLHSIPVDKSFNYLAPYIVITILFSIFTMLYFTSPWLLYNCQSVLLSPFSSFNHPPKHPLLLQHPVCLVCLWVSFSIACSLMLFFRLHYKWNHMLFVFLWLTFSLSIVLSMSIHAVANSKIYLFFMVIKSPKVPWDLPLPAYAPHHLWDSVTYRAFGGMWVAWGTLSVSHQVGASEWASLD